MKSSFLQREESAPGFETDVIESARRGDLVFFRALSGEGLEKALMVRSQAGYSPLMFAVYRKHLALAEFLISVGASPNDRDYSGNTVLMGAAFKGDCKMIKLLIKNGARPDEKNEKGMTALSFSSLFLRREAFRLLSGDSSRWLLFDASLAWWRLFSPVAKRRRA